MRFNGIDDLRKLEPGRSYLWDLSFSFEPFKNGNNASLVRGGSLTSYIPYSVLGFVPADQMTEMFASVDSSEVSVGQSTFRFAAKKAPYEITINFMDDLGLHTKRWLGCWMNSIIMCNGLGVNYIEDYVDILTIFEKDLMGNTVRSIDYVVYPDGQLSDQFTSDSGLKVFSCNFVVVGEVGHESYSAPDMSIKNISKLSAVVE